MNSLPAIGYFSKFPVQHSANYKPRRFCARIPYIFSALKTSPPPREFSGDEVLQEFLKERGLTRDFISKISYKFWIRDLITNSENLVKAEEMADNFNNATQLSTGEENDGGFLKQKRTNEWLLGDNNSLPMNKKMVIREVRDERERRKILNFLQYEAERYV